MIKPDLTFKIKDKVFKNPIFTASGTFGYADEYENYLNPSNLGSIITKGITLEPRRGNQQPRIKELKDGLINCIGLENIGINAFINNKLPILKSKNIDFIVNIAGFSFDEYFKLAEICENNKIETIELNVSCPNVKTGCLEFGNNKENLYSLVSQVRKIYKGILIVKLSPNVSDPLELALVTEEAGADAISAINTVRGLNVKLEKKENRIISHFVRGGISGAIIKNIALNFIYTISREIKIPIIGLGGINTLEDIIEFYAVGSSAVQIGTANFTNPYISQQLLEDLEQFMIENNFKNLEELKNEFIQ